MKASSLFLAFAFLIMISVTPALAQNSANPLFVSLTTDDSWRSNMALTFAGEMLEAGHPLTVALNDKGVLLASAKYSPQYHEQQRAIASLSEKGAVIYVCYECMKHYGVKQGDLFLPGLKVGSTELIGNALFKPNTRTLAW